MTCSSHNLLTLMMNKKQTITLIAATLFSGVAVAADNTINFCENTSNYVTYENAISIASGKTTDVITSRYSYWMSTVTGKGNMNVYSGGDRCFLGNAKGAKYPNWTNYSGEVHIYPYKKVVSNLGMYGLIWGHGGKTFNPEEVEKSISEGKVNNCLANNKVTLHKDTYLAAESGNRGIRIAHLDMEEGSRLMGYYKKSNTPKSYYVVGCDNTDAVIAGRIAPAEDNVAEEIGFIKEGKGTYRITGNTNIICGGLRVLDGAVLANNDAAKAKTSKLSGATGFISDATKVGVYVMQAGTIGGTGSVGSNTDVYGSIAPGDGGIGTLTFQDYAKSREVALRVRPTTKINIEIAGSEDYDKVIVNGPVEYYNIGQDFVPSTRMPQIVLSLTEGASLKEGDTFTILTAKGRKSYNNVEWQWNIKYPDAYTWDVKEESTGTGIKLVATVTSLKYGNQNEGNDDTETEDEDVREEWDYTAEKSLRTSLRYYQHYLKKYVGVAVRGWAMDISDDSSWQPSKIKNEFNAVVAENEMKFDAVEPSRGSFNFTDGDKLVNFAKRNNCRVRGHCLAWHSQVPTWLTTDGTKNTNNLSREELLSILKNHIFKVVGHWKGKIAEWDVANEVLDDNQSIIRSNPEGYTLRPSIWKTGIGEDFIDSAFVWAHEADPDAVLILNDYDVEFLGQAKTEALYNLAKRLQKSGIPINGVGLQCHLDAGKVNVSKLRANMERYAALDMVCNITELDLGIDDTSEKSLMQQADDYYAITRTAMTVDNCTTVMIWGLKDNDSWRASNPLIYDSGLNAKPAYWGVHAAVSKSYNEQTTGVCLPKVNSNNSDNSCYDLMGRKTGANPKGIIIKGRKKIAL